MQHCEYIPIVFILLFRDVTLFTVLLIVIAPPAWTTCCGLHYVLTQTRHRLENLEATGKISVLTELKNVALKVWNWGNVLAQLYLPVHAKSRISNIRTSVSATLKTKYWTMIIFELPLKTRFLRKKLITYLLAWIRAIELTVKAAVLGHGKLRKV